MATGSSFSPDEIAAMKQRQEEYNNTKGMKGAAKRAREFQACQDAIAALEGNDRTIAERLYVIVSEVAPHLDPKTWYGFPAFAKNDKVIVWYQPASKFGTRYGNVGFSEDAAIDDGAYWPTAYAVLEVTDELDKLLRDLVAKAA